MNQADNNKEFIVTARKWRPLKFKDVVGQEHITITLQNAISYNRIHHAYLFSGPRGVGKTTTARILARAVNCLEPEGTEPCNHCESCLSIIEGRSLDVIEIDGASNNSVDDVRKLRENAKYPPAGKYKMYIIDEVHMLSTSAFNALLKILEEPPPHLLFVFATTEPHKVPATILSRCQRFEFRRMSLDNIISQLKYIADRENIKIDEESLVTVAKKADGSMRDAQSIFDQVVAFCGNDIKYTEMADSLHLIDVDFYFKITDAIREKNLSALFDITKQIINKGYDLQECLDGLLEHFRNLLAFKAANGAEYIETSKAILDKYKETSEFFSKSMLIQFMNIIANAQQALKYSPQPRIRFELTLLQLGSLPDAIEISALLKDINNLKQGLPLEQRSAPAPQQKTEPPVIRDTNVGFNPKPEPPPAPPKFKTNKPPDSLMPDISLAAQAPAIPVKRGINSNDLQAGWQDFLNTYATGENGFHLLGKNAIVSPKFMNGEIILEATTNLVVDNINKRKKELLHNLNEFFGEQVSVKILASDEPDKRISHVPDVSDVKSFTTNGDSNRRDISDVDLTNKHPVEQAIITKFGAREVDRDR